MPKETDRKRDSGLMDPFLGQGGSYWNPLNPPDFWNPTSGSGGPGGSALPVGEGSYVNDAISGVATHGAAGLSLMDPTVLAAIISGGGRFLQSLFGDPGYQARTGYSQPQEHLDDVFKQIKDLAGSLNDERQHGISLPDALVRGTPTFSGGGLPFSIGLSGADSLGTLAKAPTLRTNGLIDFGTVNPDGTYAPTTYNTTPGTTVASGGPYGPNGPTGGVPHGPRGFPAPGDVPKAGPESVARRPLAPTAGGGTPEDFMRALRLLGAQY